MREITIEEKRKLAKDASISISGNRPIEVVYLGGDILIPISKWLSYINSRSFLDVAASHVFIFEERYNLDVVFEPKSKLWVVSTYDSELISVNLNRNKAILNFALENSGIELIR